MKNTFLGEQGDQPRAGDSKPTLINEMSNTPATVKYIKSDIPGFSHPVYDDQPDMESYVMTSTIGEKGQMQTMTKDEALAAAEGDKAENVFFGQKGRK